MFFIFHDDKSLLYLRQSADFKKIERINGVGDGGMTHEIMNYNVPFTCQL